MPASTKKQTLTPSEREFLQESNEIEGVYDIASLDQAIVAWEYLKAQPKLSNGVILKTHKLLMLHQPLAPNEKGYFRTVPVYIAGRKCEVFNAHGGSLSSQIKLWCVEANKDNWTGIGPVGLHIQFEKIHPFVDGNGRIGRMLLNWQNLKMGREVLVIKAAERQKYYAWFK